MMDSALIFVLMFAATTFTTYVALDMGGAAQAAANEPIDDVEAALLRQMRAARPGRDRRRCVATRDIGQAITDALGLPPDCRRVEIVLEAGQLVVVRAEHFVREPAAQAIVTRLSAFHVVPRMPAADGSAEQVGGP